MHIAGCFRRSIIVPHLCHRLPPMLFIGRSGNTVDRSLTRWVRSWRPVPAARPFGQGGMLPRYPFIRLSKNLGDHLPPHPVFHTFFAFGRKNYQTFLRKDGRHSLDFANRIKKISFAKSFFGQRKSRKRKPDRPIPVGALGKRFAAQRRNGRSLCCSFSVFLYIPSFI